MVFAVFRIEIHLQYVEIDLSEFIQSSFMRLAASKPNKFQASIPVFCHEVNHCRDFLPIIYPRMEIA